MERKASTHFIVAAALAVGAVGAAGCDDDDFDEDVVGTDYAYEDAYLYDGYYPADVAYASYYWADAWDYSYYYYLRSAPVAAAAAAPTTGRMGVVGAIQALARGEQVCPGQVTVTEKKAAPACAGPNADEVRNGVTISFNGCQTSDGTINGNIDVQSNRSASEQTCSATTIITLGHTSTITNLSFTLASGAKLVIPNQTNTGTTSYTFGQSATTAEIMSNGELQIFNSAGTMLSDHTFMGNNTFTFPGNQSYSVSGTTNVQEKNGNGSATITRNGLTRSGGCCRPTGGTMTVNRTGGLAPGEHDWSFGPSCGTVTRDGVTATMPACL
jgi:hypothetical protein